MSMLEPLLTPSEVAYMYDVDEFTIYSMVKSGEIPHVKFGPFTVRFRRSDIDDWLCENGPPQIVEPPPEQPRKNENSGVYLFRIAGTNKYKIGISKDIKLRLRGLRSSVPVEIEFVASRRGFRAVERRLHEMNVRYCLDPKRSREWFAFDDYEEAVAAFLANRAYSEQNERECI